MISRSVSAGRYLHVELIWWRAIDLDRVLEMQKVKMLVGWVGGDCMVWGLEAMSRDTSSSRGVTSKHISFDPLPMMDSSACSTPIVC